MPNDSYYKQQLISHKAEQTITSVLQPIQIKWTDDISLQSCQYTYLHLGLLRTLDHNEIWVHKEELPKLRITLDHFSVLVGKDFEIRQAIFLM
jgi:hypothetical protein